MSTAPKIDPRQIDYLPLSALTPDPRNPKAHDDEMIDASIGRFGILDLIVQDQRTGYIVSGHGRHGVLTQMQQRGESAPEGVKLGEDGSWLVPVVTGWASRTDTEAAAALIALNRTTELGGWVDDNLLDLLDDLQEAEDGLAGVGYSEKEIDELRDWVGHVEDAPAESGAPRDLDKLGEEYGEMTEEDSAVQVTVTLPREVAQAFSEAVAEYEDDQAWVTEWLESRGQ